MGPILVRTLVTNRVTSLYNLNYFHEDQTVIVQVFWVSEVYCLYFCQDLSQIYWHFRLGGGHHNASEVGGNNASHQLYPYVKSSAP